MNKKKNPKDAGELAAAGIVREDSPFRHYSFAIIPSPLKSLLRSIIAVLGRQVRDERTGEVLGKALVLSLGGRAWLIGLHHPYVRPVFLPESRVKYGRHRIGFATHPPVDYPRLVSPSAILLPDSPSPSFLRHLPLAPASPSSDISAIRYPPSAIPHSPILWAILVHQPPEECRSILDCWLKLGFDPSHILLVHGGAKADFDRLDHENAVFVPDENLRTVCHPVEKQSYAGPMRETARWMSDRPFSRVCLVEYDHIPLVPDWGRRLEVFRLQDDADVLFHHLVRVDGTNAPHYLYHLSDPRFRGAWESTSIREDPHVVLNSLATGSFWTREAFDAVAHSLNPPSAIRHSSSAAGRPIYLEMDLPTTAHHLGFRVRDMGEQNAFATITPRTRADCEPACAQGAWSLHPVKEK